MPTTPVDSPAAVGSRWPRSGIARLMLGVAVVAVVLGLLRTATFLTIMGLNFLTLALPAWFPSRRRPRLAAAGFILSAAWLNLALGAFFACYPYLHNSVWLFLSALLFIPIVPSFGVAWVGHQPPRRRAGATVLLVAVTALAGSMIVTRWPFHLGFSISAAALHRIADRVEAGGKVVPGEWAGLYRVWGTRPLAPGDDTLLLIDTSPSGQFGFARRRPPFSSGAARGDQFEGGRWYTVDED